MLMSFHQYNNKIMVNIAVFNASSISYARALIRFMEGKEWN